MFFYEYPTLSYHLKAVFYFIWYFLLCFSEIPFTIDCTTFLNLFDVVDLGFQSENKKLILSSMDRLRVR
jgi:hypothetical protein